MSDKLTRPGSLGAGQMGVDRRTTQDLVNLKRESDEAGVRLTALEARRHVAVRQTVMASRMDSDGKPAFLSVSGDAVNILATERPLILGFADGFNEYGSLDYIKKIIADVPSAFSGFQGLAPNYLYALLGDDGEVTYGHTPYQPQYGRVFDKSRYSLLHFEGADGSTDIVDEWGNTWTVNGNAHIETDDKKFGSSSLYLDGTGDYITSIPRRWGQTWSIDFWHKPLNLSASRYLFGADGWVYSLTAYIAATTGRITLAAGNGLTSSYNILSGTSTNGIINNTWNHIAITYDGAYFRLYLNGLKEIEQACTDRFYTVQEASGICIGARPEGAYGLYGYVDEVRYMADAILFGSNFDGALPAVPYTKPDIPFFSIPEMRMYKGTDEELTAWRALFLGEAIVGADGDPTSVVNYALNGEYFGPITIIQGADVSFADNIGTEEKVPVCYLRQHGNYRWTLASRFYPGAYYGTAPLVYNRNASVATCYPGQNMGHGSVLGLGSFYNSAVNDGEVKIIVKRAF